MNRLSLYPAFGDSSKKRHRVSFSNNFAVSSIEVKTSGRVGEDVRKPTAQLAPSFLAVPIHSNCPHSSRSHSLERWRFRNRRCEAVRGTVGNGAGPTTIPVTSALMSSQVQGPPQSSPVQGESSENEPAECACYWTTETREPSRVERYMKCIPMNA
jgi:hypothetical protein